MPANPEFIVDLCQAPYPYVLRLLVSTPEFQIS